MAKEPVFPIFKMESVGRDIIHVEMSAANLMQFDLRFDDILKYDEMITDICNLAPAAMRLDVELMEQADGSRDAKPSREDRLKIRAFASKYRKQLSKCDMPFEEFEGIY